MHTHKHKHIHTRTYLDWAEHFRRESTGHRPWWPGSGRTGSVFRPPWQTSVGYWGDVWERGSVTEGMYGREEQLLTPFLEGNVSSEWVVWGVWCVCEVRCEVWGSEWMNKRTGGSLKYGGAKTCIGRLNRRLHITCLSITYPLISWTEKTLLAMTFLSCWRVFSLCSWKVNSYWKSKSGSFSLEEVDLDDEIMKNIGCSLHTILSWLHELVNLVHLHVERRNEAQ